MPAVAGRLFYSPLGCSKDNHSKDRHLKDQTVCSFLEIIVFFVCKSSFHFFDPALSLFSHGFLFI